MSGALLRPALLLMLLAVPAACTPHGPKPEDERWFRPPYEDCPLLDCGAWQWDMRVGGPSGAALPAG